MKKSPIDDLSDIEIVEDDAEPELPENLNQVPQASEMEFRRYGLALQDFFGDNFVSAPESVGRVSLGYAA